MNDDSDQERCCAGSGAFKLADLLQKNFGCSTVGELEQRTRPDHRERDRTEVVAFTGSQNLLDSTSQHLEGVT